MRAKREAGFTLTELLVDAFPDVLNVEFTAGMETVLDDIEEGKRKWLDAMREFYEPFARDHHFVGCGLHERDQAVRDQLDVLLRIFVVQPTT